MLEGAAHVAQVGGGPIGSRSLEHVGRRKGQRRPTHDVNAFDIGIGRPGYHRLEHLLGMRRRRVMDDQQRGGEREGRKGRVWWDEEQKREEEEERGGEEVEGGEGRGEGS